MRRQFSGVVVYCCPCNCWPGEHIPQPKFRLEASVGLGDPTGNQRLRIDLPPVGKARQRVDIRDSLDMGGRVDRREQARALQVGRDDLHSHCVPSPGLALRCRRNQGSRSASAATLPCVTSSLSTAAARSGKRPVSAGRRAARAHHEQPAAVQRPAKISRSALDHWSVLWRDGTDRHPRIMSRGSKVISMSFHCS